MTSTLRVDTALYGSAVLLDRLLALLLLPLLTRAIGAHDYGAWTQTLVAAGVLMPLVLFALPTAVVRSFSGAAGAAGRWHSFVRLGGVALALFAAFAALLLAAREPASLLVWGETGRSSLMPALLSMLAADAGIEFGVAWLRAAGRIGWISGVLVVRSVLRYLVIWGLVAGGGVPLAEWVGPYAATQCALALVVLAGTAALLRCGSDAAASAGGPRLRELLAFALPLVGLALFTTLNATLDRFLLVHLVGLDGVAVYAAAVSLCMVPAVFYSVLGFTLFPVLARHWGERRLDQAARLTSLALQAFAFLCLPVSLGIALAGPWLLPLLSTGAYRAAPAVFVLLGVSVTAFGLYQILLYILLLDGRSRQVLALALGAAAVNLTLNLALAPRLGAVGAAAAAALSNLMMVAVAARLARRVMAWQFPWARLWPIAWRAALAALPLAWALWPGPAAGPIRWPLNALASAGLIALCAGLYLGLDWHRAGSLTRQLVFR